MRPIIETQITQHTLWQALTGHAPPLALPAAPVVRAVLDSRDVQPGDLFVALPGQQTDGHLYIGDALSNGAQVVLSEERGVEAARAAGALVIDCRAGLSRDSELGAAPINSLRGRAIVYLVEDGVAALQQAGAFQRLHRARAGLRVVGVTGSVGKSSTKELAAAVLRQRFQTLSSEGNLNNEQGLPLTLLGLGPQHERAVLEMGMYALGEIRTLCTLARPHVGVITNVGPSHLDRLGTMERIADAKAELIEALPSAREGGVAILNWDDERVRLFRERTSAAIFRYGLSQEADLWADEIESRGMEGIRFRFHFEGWQGDAPHLTDRDTLSKSESLYINLPLLGRHSVHTALRAAAVGLVEGMSWAEIIAGMQRLTSHLRLVTSPGINGSTLIDDTYNASPASTVAALNLLADLAPAGEGRRVAVLGDMLELGHLADEGHKLVGRRAAQIVDLLITVGDLGREIGEAAMDSRLAAERTQIVATDADAIALLHDTLRADDLVLIKGSRAVGMDSVVAGISRTT